MSGEKDVKERKRRGMKVMRTSAQLTFLALFVAAAWSASYPPSELYADNLFLRVDPLNAVLNHTFVYSLTLFLPALILLALTALSGRFFCAWVCPLGTCFDVLPSAGRHGRRTLKSIRPRTLTGKVPEKGARRLRLKYGFLALLAVLYVANIGLIWLFDPLVIANRAVMFILGGTVPLIFIGLVVLAMAFKPRYWCQELCPTGALFSAASALGKWLPGWASPLAVRKDEESCTHCGRCAVACPFEITAVADSRRTGRLALADCALCGECVAACPCDGALELTSFGRAVYSSGRAGTCELPEEGEVALDG